MLGRALGKGNKMQGVLRLPGMESTEVKGGLLGDLSSLPTWDHLKGLLL